jgi:RHS repeat-associated protein
VARASSEWVVALASSQGPEGIRTILHCGGEDFREFMVGWVRKANVPERSTASLGNQIDAAVPVYLDIVGVDGELLIVSGDVSALVTAEETEFCIIHPVGVNPQNGATQTNPCQPESRYLWGGGYYLPPIVGFEMDHEGVFGIHGQQPGQNKSGQHYMWNRRYDIHMGRWTSPDPVQSPEWNLNLYCHSDPLRRLDPTGLRAAKTPPEVHSSAEQDIDVQTEPILGETAYDPTVDIGFPLPFGDSSYSLSGPLLSNILADENLTPYDENECRVYPYLANMTVDVLDPTKDVSKSETTKSYNYSTNATSLENAKEAMTMGFETGLGLLSAMQGELDRQLIERLPAGGVHNLKYHFRGTIVYNVVVATVDWKVIFRAGAKIQYDVMERVSCAGCEPEYRKRNKQRKEKVLVRDVSVAGRHHYIKEGTITMIGVGWKTWETH